MEPRIQYAKTSDGVSIACWTLGEGPPLVTMAAVFSSQQSWQNPEGRRWIERLAEKRRLVRYDSRGFGMSDRNVTEYSLDVHVLDLEAVVDHLGLEQFALFAGVYSGPVAIAFAVRHPERVSHLILWRTVARTQDLVQSPKRTQALLDLADADWQLYTETVAHDALGWSAGETARRYAAGLRQDATPESLRGAMAAAFAVDVSGLLSQVRSPALVPYRRGWPQATHDGARALASGKPGARLVAVEGDAISPYGGDMEPLAKAIDEFLGEGDEAAAPPAAAPTGMVTILFTDMEGSTTLRRNLGDATVQELVRAHNEIVRDALKTSGGSEIKHTGDGIMASFSTATSAIQCAIAIQQGVASHAEDHPDVPLGVYIGLNAGEPIAEEQDLFGTSVDLAKRICEHAQPGQILASNVVRELSAGKGFLFADIGEVVPKGFEEPVRLHEVRWRE